ncbi:MAG: hypothetical protein RLY93_19400 [Sumerlaeia bacterium]
MQTISEAARRCAPEAAAFAVLLLIFWLSPVAQMADSQFTLLLSQNLVEGRGFDLAHYFAEPPPGAPPDLSLMRGLQPDGAYPAPRLLQDPEAPRLEPLRYGDSPVRLWYPHGPALLSLPWVAAQELAGFHTAAVEGRHDYLTEVRSQRHLAAILGAVFGMLVVRMARALGWRGWVAALFAVVFCLATPVWSTASRAVWSHSWGIVLVGAALAPLLRYARGEGPARPVLVATLLSWAVFCRPTYALAAAGITIWILARKDWRSAGWLIGTGAVWGVAFVGYSLAVFGQWLPDYYLMRPGGGEAFWANLWAVLASPARGAFVYVPFAPVVLLGVCSRWRTLPQRGLAVLALGVMAAQVLLIARWEFWHGGIGFGPRLLTDLVPWLAVLTLLAAEDWRLRDPRPRWPAAILAVALALSAAIQSAGAFVQETFDWESLPAPATLFPQRYTNWRDMPLLRVLPPDARPVAAPAPPFGRAMPAGGWYGESRLYLGPHWDYFSEPEHTWSLGARPEIHFSLPDSGPTSMTLTIQAFPYLAEGRIGSQTVRPVLNGEVLAELKVAAPGHYGIHLPAQALRGANRLVLELPGAVSPAESEHAPDRRVLGIALQSLRFDRE